MWWGCRLDSGDQVECHTLPGMMRKTSVWSWRDCRADHPAPLLSPCPPAPTCPHRAPTCSHRAPIVPPDSPGPDCLATPRLATGRPCTVCWSQPAPVGHAVRPPLLKLARAADEALSFLEDMGQNTATASTPVYAPTLPGRRSLPLIAISLSSVRQLQQDSRKMLLVGKWNAQEAERVSQGSSHAQVWVASAAHAPHPLAQPSVHLRVAAFHPTCRPNATATSPVLHSRDSPMSPAALLFIGNWACLCL